MVKQEVVGRLTSSNVDVRTEMRYDPADPFAVHFTFLDTENRVMWTFARDLVNEAIANGKAGEGDVQASVEGNKFILFLNPGGDTVAHVSYPLSAVKKFASRCEGVVASGTEGCFYSIDREIGEWFSNDLS